MRILQVFEKVGHGGTEVVIKHLSMEFLKMGQETALWVREKGDKIENLNIIVSEVYPSDYKPDIILVHGGFWGTGKYLGMNEIETIPIVEIIHRNVLVDGNATFYISPSMHIMEMNKKIGNIQYIGNPVFLDNKYIERDAERLKYGIEKDDFVITRHARFDTEKGWLRFMWIMDKILKTNSNVICLICGEGDARLTKILKNWARGKRCVFINWVEDTSTLLKISDAYLETSEGEAFGLSAAEAAMAYLPVVSFDVKGINELLGRSYYCVPNNNMVMCVDKMQELIDDREKCLQEGKRNHENIYNRYNGDLIAKQYLFYLNTICELSRMKNKFIEENNRPEEFHNMIKQSFCKKFGVSYCIRIYWLLNEWLYRMNMYSLDENVSYILQNIEYNSVEERGINSTNLVVELISRYSASACCLNKAVIKSLLLYEQGFDSTLVYGVFKSENKLEGHSWVEMKNGKILDFQDAYKSCIVTIKKEIFHEQAEC